MNPFVMWSQQTVPTSEDLRVCGMLSGKAFFYTFNCGMQFMVVLPSDVHELKESDVMTDGRTNVQIDLARLASLCRAGSLMPLSVIDQPTWTTASTRPLSP